MCANVYIHEGRRIVGAQSFCFVGKLAHYLLCCLLFKMDCEAWRWIGFLDFVMAGKCRKLGL
jgi:hypothetical protein